MNHKRHMDSRGGTCFGAGALDAFRRSCRAFDHSTRHRGGFTFAELLAAMVFVAIVIPVAIHGLTIANRAGVVAERKRVAAQLADRLLAEFVVTEDWRTGDRSGDFGDELPGFRWVIDDETWDEDEMRLVSVEVFFYAQGREYSIRLSTLADESEEEEEE